MSWTIKYSYGYWVCCDTGEEFGPMVRHKDAVAIMTAFENVEKLTNECSTLKAEAERLKADNETWAEKARAWMASPEAAARLDEYRKLGERAATAEAKVELLREALHEIADLAGWHCDLNADPEDTSPEDMAAHINGLIVQKAQAACEEGGSYGAQSC